MAVNGRDGVATATAAAVVCRCGVRRTTGGPAAAGVRDGELKCPGGGPGGGGFC